VLSGNLLEGKRFARKGTILLATVVQCIGSFILATTSNFPTFVAGSILMGFGVGLYWPATQTFIADTTGSTGIEEAIALTLLADYA
ncbi:MFS transporter, partial [Escherichia coli]|uniref:MFS transporter n=1 Tax=Escherichia coli TaxID=562 RepID=UPI0039E05288